MEEDFRPTSEQPDLAALLTHHKTTSKIGDARLARLCCELANDRFFIHRSTIRNWSTGASRSALNWRPIAALASVLRLELDEANQLLRAAGCPAIQDLRRNLAADDHRFLEFWSSSDTKANADPEPEQNPQNRSSAECISPKATGEYSPSNSTSRPPILSLKRVRSSLNVATGSIVGLSALLIAGLVYTWSQFYRTNETAPNAPQPPAGNTVSMAPPNPGLPVSEILSPSAGVVRGGRVSFSGTSSFSLGILDVVLLLAKKDPSAPHGQVYWRSDTMAWQKEFNDFPVAVSPKLSPKVSWQYQLPELTPNVYRVRVWARGGPDSLGKKDRIAPLLEFRFEADDSDTVLPDSHRLIFEENRLLIDGAIDSHPDLKSILLSVVDKSRNKYWNPDQRRWQLEFNEFKVPIRTNQDESNKPAGKYQWRYQVPGILPGDYSSGVRFIMVDAIKSGGAPATVSVPEHDR